MTNLYSAPICISSPVRRSGTTLLQRLISSSPNGLIYGESCANDLQLFSNFLGNKQYLFEASKESRNDQLKRVLEGDVNFWMPDLMPEIDGYMSAFKSSVFSLLNYYATYAEQQGRPTWGMKMPEWNPANLVFIQQMMPETKIIYLHRNLEDCVRSAKKIDMIRGLDELQRFCGTWKQYGNYAKLHLKGENVLHLSYEALLANPSKYIKNIEQFSDITQIDEEVMNIKINTYFDDQRLQGETHKYLNPDMLSDEEIAMIDSFSEPVPTAST